MVKAKQTDSVRDWIARDLERIESEYGPVIKERYYVIEHRPAYNTGGYYDQDVPAENKVVSPFFNTEDEAQDWLDKHEPDKDKSLHLRKEKLQERTHVTREWRTDYKFNRDHKGNMLEW